MDNLASIARVAPAWMGVTLALVTPLLGQSENECLKVEIKGSRQLTHWVPESILGARINTSGLDVWAIEAKVQAPTPSDLRFFLPRTLRYEFTEGSDSPLNNKIIELQSQPRDSYARFFADLPLVEYWGRWVKEGLGKLRGRHGGGYRYEAFAFTSRLRLEEDKTFVPLTGTPQQLVAGQEIMGTTVFEKHSLLYDYARQFEDPQRSLVEGRFAVGFFYLDYIKPYAITILNVQELETIREGHFAAAGLELCFGWTHAWKLGESSRLAFRHDWLLDGGWGDIEFSGGRNIELPGERSLGYTGFGVDLGLELRVLEYLSIDITGSYRYHRFEMTGDADGDPFSLEQEDLKINEDDVLSLSLGLVLKF